MAKPKRAKKDMNQDMSNILENNDTINSQQLMTNLRRAKLNVEFRNESQKIVWNKIDKNQIFFAFGPAGTGKSYISALKAVDLVLHTKNNDYKKIIIIKPAVEADEKNGFLPGSLFEKMYPFVFSTLYILEKILGKNKVEKCLELNLIEVMSLAYMRGINLDECILIMEEAQNMTIKQMITLLTRIGEHTKFIISGDISQSDRYKDGKDSGLYYAMEKLKDIEEIDMIEFSQDEIVRNPLISKMLDRFNGDVE